MADDAESGLISRAQAGDPRAFAALVRSYQERVFRFILRLVGARDDAMDLTQHGIRGRARTFAESRRWRDGVSRLSVVP